MAIKSFQRVPKVVHKESVNGAQHLCVLGGQMLDLSAALLKLGTVEIQQVNITFMLL